MNKILRQLVWDLAFKRQVLAALQGEAEQIIGRCETIEAESEKLTIDIGVAAVETGEEHPHPAVTVVEQAPYVPRIEIAADLSEYL